MSDLKLTALNSQTLQIYKDNYQDNDFGLSFDLYWPILVVLICLIKYSLGTDILC